MRIGPWWRAACVAAMLAVAPTARAQTIDDAQAAALERQVRDWLAALLGPAIPLSARPIEVTAEGDHDRIAIPCAGDIGPADTGGARIGSAAAALTMMARPLDGGRWALDDIRFPSPLAISVLTPQGGTGSWTLTTEAQDQHAVLDPTLATASRFDSTLKGYQSVAEQPGGVSRTRVEQVTTHAAFDPEGDGRGALSIELDLQFLAVNADMPPSGPISVSAAQGRVSLHAARLAPDRLGSIVRALASALPQALATARTEPPRPRLPEAARAALHSAVADLAHLAGGFDEQTAMTDVRVRGAHFGGHADQLAAGIAVSSARGKLTLGINLAADGLDSPDLPPGALHDLFPRRISLAPRVSGLPAAEIEHMLLHTIDDEEAPDGPGDGEALLRHGPVVVALDDLALAAGPTTLTGHGSLTLAAMDRITGHAHLSATGLDALIRMAGDAPLLQRALPMLLVLKGLGTQKGDSVVWDVTYRNGKVLVNGADISKIVPRP